MNINRNTDQWVTQQKQKNILLKAKITISQFVKFDHLQKSSSSVYSTASGTSPMWTPPRRTGPAPHPARKVCSVSGGLSASLPTRSLGRKATASPSNPPWPQQRALRVQVKPGTSKGLHHGMTAFKLYPMKLTAKSTQRPGERWGTELPELGRL